MHFTDSTDLKDLDLDLDHKDHTDLKLWNTPSRKLSVIMEMHNPVDIWRIQHPDTVRYTHREKTKFSYKQTQLDYFFIPSSMGYITTLTDINPSIKSDHSLLHIQLPLLDQQKRGKGMWKLNVNLLTDKEYIEFMKKVLKDSISDAKIFKAQG